MIDYKKILLAAMMLVLPSMLFGQSKNLSSSQTKFFESKIRPALIEHCYSCHSVDANDSRGGLLVDTRKALLDGGNSGPAVVPGDLDESLLWHAINWEGYEMPPSKKMPDHVIEDFKKWIEMGAPDPRQQEIVELKATITKEDIRKGKKHWAYQRPKRKSGANIDVIVSDKLNESGLQPADPADPLTLLRRLNFDLIGLPPTPVEIVAFKKAWTKNADQALVEKVDELLARPQYGERWGRHWLDVARYAESSGSRNFTFPHAWRYRDYVIDSFNDDTPYDRFLAEQIAGDLLPVKSDKQFQENLIATGFMAIGLKHLNQKNPRIFMADMVDEQIDTLTQAVLGVTVACARCHDHKYDPIPTHDYYALAGIMRSTKTLYGTHRIAQNHRPSGLLLLPVLDDKSLDKTPGNQSVAALKSRLQQARKELASLGRNRADGDAKSQRKRIMRNIQRIEGELATLNADGTKKTFGMGVQEASEMVNAHILLGGEVERPAQQVQRGFIQILGELNFEVKGNTSGRRELVRALTSKTNPLTARVMVNRIWMHLLGRPIVGTPNNFGFSGMEPENQELLDYLAIRFMQKDWSVKSMIREIVKSDTYRRSSNYIERNYVVDPDNKLLWRYNPRQLDAEAMRDAMLALAGRLDLDRPHGSPVAISGDGSAGGVKTDSTATYRSVYLPIVRDSVLDTLHLFDFPDPNVTSATRQESIVPTQALYMLNGGFVSVQARSMAASLSENFLATGDQVKHAFLRAYGRPATKEELQVSAQFFKEFQPTQNSIAQQRDTTQLRGSRKRSSVKGKRNRRRLGGRVTDPSVAQTSDNQALSVFCQTLMASARFRILN